jgi:hypothetical protein
MKGLAVMQSGFMIALLIMKFMPNSIAIGISATHNIPLHTDRRKFIIGDAEVTGGG